MLIIVVFSCINFHLWFKIILTEKAEVRAISEGLLKSVFLSVYDPYERWNTLLLVEFALSEYLLTKWITLNAIFDEF